MVSFLGSTELAVASGTYSISLTLVFAVGFIVAAIVGSIAWYNSRRPPGWEDKERPDIVPEIEK
ncbi:MAG: hypothetical protein VKL39_02020 [Leptolyngbyaceae bacterium]|nr:hypothetical protein [Leptolyngbyaceae bacterium]